MKLERVKISTLMPDPSNARKHDQKNLDARELIWENGKLSIYLEGDILYCQNEDQQLRAIPREFGEHYKELSKLHLKKYYADTDGNL